MTEPYDISQILADDELIDRENGGSPTDGWGNELTIPR